MKLVVLEAGLFHERDLLPFLMVRMPDKLSNYVKLSLYYLK